MVFDGILGLWLSLLCVMNLFSFFHIIGILYAGGFKFGIMYDSLKSNILGSLSFRKSGNQFILEKKIKQYFIHKFYEDENSLKIFIKNHSLIDLNNYNLEII